MKLQEVKKIEVVAVKENKLQKLFSGELVNRWLKFAAVSEKSIATYKGCLKQLAKYFSDNGIAAPARADLENWRDMLIDGGKSASTICLYLTAAKLFFRFLAQEGIYPNIADHLKNRVKVDRFNHKKDALSVKQAKDLQKAIKGKDLKALRDRAIVALMLTTGLRTIEICRADICDIRQIEGKNFLFVQGKGRSEKSESVLLADKVYEKIQLYLKARGKAGRKEPLFVSTSRRNKGGRLDTRTIRGLVKDNLRKIGVDSPTLSAHSLRHTAACVMFQQKQKLTDIQMTLRHRNISTSMIYLNTINRMKNRAEIAAAQVLII